MAEIVLIGGGICGLATALVLARDGHDVTVLERDPAPGPDSPDEAWETWERPGVAQFRQAHWMHPRGRSVLEAELPDVREALLAAGVPRFDTLSATPPTLPALRPQPDDERFATISGRRTTLEQVVARTAAEQPRLRVERGASVIGLLTRTLDGTPHVTGVRTSDGREWHGDLVVDASGRRSRAPALLRDAGAAPLHEEAEESGFSYYTRFFRSPTGSTPEARGPLAAPIGTFSILTLPGDRGTWSVTVFTSSHDRPLKELRHEDAWTAVVAACPLQEHWLDGRPLTGVLPMAGTTDRYRRLVVDGRPVATGLALVADSWACTNPSLGRGISLGLMHATLLRDVLRTARDEPRELLLAWDAASESELGRWYRSTVAIDRARAAEIDALLKGRGSPPPQGPAAVTAAFNRGMQFDEEVFRAYMEVVGLLALPREVFARPGMVERVLAVAEEHPPEPPLGPDRDQLLALVSDARIPAPRRRSSSTPAVPS